MKWQVQFSSSNSKRERSYWDELRRMERKRGFIERKSNMLQYNNLVLRNQYNDFKFFANDFYQQNKIKEAPFFFSATCDDHCVEFQLLKLEKNVTSRCCWSDTSSGRRRPKWEAEGGRQSTLYIWLSALLLFVRVMLPANSAETGYIPPPRT